MAPGFEYFRPESTASAVQLLAQFGGDAKILAGGQSLMPLINMRLAWPAVLIDINRIGELAFVREQDGWLVIGAMTRHAVLERSEVVGRRNPLLAYATSLIAHPTIRARATLGGSMAHADPAAEYPSVALAMGAELVALSQRGERRIAAATFFKGLLTTDLGEDELLVEVRLPEQPADEGWAYAELATRPGDYATVGVIARLSLSGDGRCRTASLTCTAVGATPLTARKASAMLIGELPTHANFDAAAALAAEEVTPDSDALTSASYKRAMTRVMTRRALEAALRRAQNS